MFSGRLPLPSASLYNLLFSFILGNVDYSQCQPAITLHVVRFSENFGTWIFYCEPQAAEVPAIFKIGVAPTSSHTRNDDKASLSSSDPLPTII